MPKNAIATYVRLLHEVGDALRRPSLIEPYLRRAVRDGWLWLKSPDHVSYYRAVMASDVARNPDRAVGSPSRDQWLETGKMQFDYLVEHGLRPDDRVLEIGCGNLRAGWRLIDYLDTGHYYGIDISPDVLVAAKKTLVMQGIQSKVPHLTLVQDLKLDFLPAGYFTVVHAHSVFSHTPPEDIEECLANVRRVMAPEGFFDFTFYRTEGEEHHLLREDFFYRSGTLIALAEKYGLRARFMNDWENLPHNQSKIRVTVDQPVLDGEVFSAT
ncbi:methyltransferase [Streptomyces sp. NPDC046727]|uniref:methyltransferase n=1 Tax=Streptomyces sp. NPDC046727 TaxID=3155373 RepID=UPI0033DB0292